MNKMSSTTDFEVPDVSASTNVMLKRVFGIAKILATVANSRDFQEEFAENCTENLRPVKLQYREDESKHSSNR